MRLLAGAEALNGLLLIGWSASFIYISMERFWGSDSPAQNEANPPWSVLTFRRFSERSILIGSAITISVIFVLDLLTGVEIRLHVLYIFPLAMVATNCAQPRMSIAAIVITTILQVITFSIQAIGIVAFLADICVAFAASILTIVLGRASRSSYLVAVNQAATDPLTGLANRRAFLVELQAEITRQQRYGDLFSLAILDLDGLKALNDSKGHSAGDEALKLMAEILRFGTRRSDTLGRLGGDEFAVVMPNTQDSDCGILLQKLCETIARQMAAAGFAITASVGCRTFRVPPESAADALQQADDMMYDAKRDGKNCVVQS
jgi:diguanylate cyclase (GGDEF)-like protein